MSTWTAPATFASTTLTAATMNTEVRDHLTFLKGALDLITNSTTADTGTATVIRITRGLSSDVGLETRVTGDTQTRFVAMASGELQWGSGSAVTDTYIGRDCPAGLLMTGRFSSARTTAAGASFQAKVVGDADETRFIIRADGVMAWGPGSSALDASIYRNAASVLKTDGGIWSGGGLITLIKAGVPADGDFATGMQQSGLIAVDTTNSRIYVRVGTTWKYAALT